MGRGEFHIIAAFESTTLALKFEREAGELGIEGRLIPVPREIRAGCGLCFAAPIKEKEKMLSKAKGEEGIGLYELSI